MLYEAEASATGRSFIAVAPWYQLSFSFTSDDDNPSILINMVLDGGTSEGANVEATEAALVVAATALAGAEGVNSGSVGLVQYNGLVPTTVYPT